MWTPISGPAAALSAVGLALCAGASGCRPTAPEAETSEAAEAVAAAPSSDPSTAVPPLHEGAIFVDRSAEAGLDFVHRNGFAGEYYLPENMGSGGALADLDGDGDLDLFLVQGHGGGDRLYRNDLDPSGGPRFADVSGAAGLDPGDGDPTVYGMGVAAADVDNDGRVDLYVTRFGANQLLLNRGDDGRIRFEDRTEAWDVAETRWSVPAVFFDFDRDGWLDLYLGNYLDFTFARHRLCTTRAGAPDYCAPEVYGGVGDRLWRNRGPGGGFEDVSARSGLAAESGKALGAVAADFDGDGWLDLYVANDGTPNHLWMNAGDGTFRDEAMLAGCAVSGEGLSEASMGVDAADFDGDGDLDLILSHLTGETHTLYVNDGRGNFDDRTAAAGLAAPSLAATGFGIGWIDVDSDGLLDLVSANGAVRSLEELARAGDPYPFAQADQLFRGLPDGRYEEISERAGPAFSAAAVGRGVLFGDVDNDGDTDVVRADNGAPARLLVNRAGDGRAWLGVRLVTAPAGRPRDALGARVAIERPGRPLGWRRVATDGSYAAANDPRVLFGLGEGSGGELTARVVWPDGREERFTGLEPQAYATLVQGTGEVP